MQIGIAGLGRMGAAMAARLMDVGHTLSVWNRSPEKAGPLVDAGATLAATPEGETPGQQRAILQALFSAGSCLTLLPLQDAFGWIDRINTPAVVDEVNWTWRLPWPADTWLDREDTVARADELKAWTRAADR